MQHRDPFRDFEVQELGGCLFISGKMSSYVKRFRDGSSHLFGDWSKPWYLVNPKIAGKWMFIPLKCILIGIDPYPFHLQGQTTLFGVFNHCSPFLLN